MTREEAKTFMHKLWRETMTGSYAEKAIDMAIKALGQPEIVRCRECKYYRALHNQDDLCVWTMTSVEADDYCSYAESREGETK